jgi:hypothetical protein
MKGLPMESVRHMCEIGRAESLEDEDDEEERKRDAADAFDFLDLLVLTDLEDDGEGDGVDDLANF